MLRSLFISRDPELWDIIEYGYEAPKGTTGVEISRKDLNFDKKKQYKMHDKARTFMVNAINFKEF